MSKSMLKLLVSQAQELINTSVTSSDQRFKSWHRRTLRFLEENFGKEDSFYREFDALDFFPCVTSFGSYESDSIKSCREDLITAIGLLEDILMFYENDIIKKKKKDTVFIVHGHDEKMKYQLKAYLLQLGLKATILHEQINRSDTIIEKLEKYGKEADAAIILFTPDDFGQAKNEEDAKSRARQNVVFEAGYFMGLLGRENVILLVSDKKIELPGDLKGVVYEGDGINVNIAKELKSMGLDIDLNKVVI